MQGRLRRPLICAEERTSGASGDFEGDEITESQKKLIKYFFAEVMGDWVFRARASTAEQTRSTVMVNGAMWPLKSNGLKTGSFLGLEKVHSEHTTKTKFKTLKHFSFSFHLNCIRL